MLKQTSLCTLLLVAGGASSAQTASAPVMTAAPKTADASSLATEKKVAAATANDSKADSGPKELSGMSILGNQEAPKALVIVPWKSSQLGEPPGIGKDLDDSRRPVDKEVFMRELAYYEIRVNSK